MTMDTHCPSCRNKGKGGLKPVTMQSLLTVDLSEAGELDDYRHCPAPDCDVAYYSPETGKTLSKDLVKVRIGTKEAEAPRPVCYCFQHTWESIEADLRETGKTDVVERITEHCRKGEDRCPEMNPQGACCLGNVRRAVTEVKTKLEIADGFTVPPPVTNGGLDRRAMADASVEADCCAVPEPAIVAPVQPNVAKRKGLFVALGGLTAAILSSACCWLPLLLIAVGAGTTSVGGFFDEYRSVLLVGTAGLLGASFYLVYFHEEKCLPGRACAVPSPRYERVNKITLWVATLPAVIFAFFPNYIGTALNAAERLSGAMEPVATEGPTEFVVEGMTCEGCTVHIEEAVAKLPGAMAAVSCAKNVVRVTRTNGSINDAMIVLAIAEAGYMARPTAAVATRFVVEGMTCESCIEHLEIEVGKVAGVSAIAVSYSEKLLIVVHNEGAIKSDAVIAAVRDAGYTADVSE